MSQGKSAAHTPGALRAAKLIARSEKLRPLVFGGILREEAAETFAAIIDRETAAPTMLEALEEWLKYQQDVIDVGGSKSPLSPELVLRFAHIQSIVSERIVRAIRLARGESQ